jgi:hypothetical protein
MPALLFSADVEIARTLVAVGLNAIFFILRQLQLELLLAHVLCWEAHAACIAGDLQFA